MPVCLFSSLSVCSFIRLFIHLFSELEELSKSELESILNSDPTHKACQQELKQLKDEFERYKVKTQALHRNRSTKELSAQLENVEKLKAKIKEVEQHKAELRDFSQKRENEQDEVIKGLREDVKHQGQIHKREMDDWKLVYQQKLSELEKQVLRQRERTLSLLAEKDSEIEGLRTRSPSSSPSRPDAAGVSTFSYPRKFVDLQNVNSGTQSPAESCQSTDTDAAVCQLLARNSGVRGKSRNPFTGRVRFLCGNSSSMHANDEKIDFPEFHGMWCSVLWLRVCHNVDVPGIA